jgi:hypothetical protein
MWLIVSSITVAFLSVGASAQAAVAPSGIVLGPLSTLGSPFGSRADLSAVMSPSGETILAWNFSAGFGVGAPRSVQSASIAPGATAAGPISTLSAGSHCSLPTLAAAAGRTAVAWFEGAPAGGVEETEVVALKVRDLLPGGKLEAARTAWQPGRHTKYSGSDLVDAVDPAGDEVVAWITWQEGQQNPSKWTVMVSSRRASGTFTKPVALTREATDVSPAVAMSLNGEATVVWPGPDGQQVLTSTWPAGGPPGPTAVLDRYNPAGYLATFERFRDLQIQTDASGGELATWLDGLPERGDRPHAVVLKAAWRPPGADFAPSQTVSAGAAEAREPAVALNAAGMALIAWNEITSSGLGPVLSYASAPPGGAFDPPTATAAAIGQRPELAAAWLPDGSVLLFWRSNHSLFALRGFPGTTFPAPATVFAHLEELGNGVMAAGGASDPVFAWLSGSRFFAPTEQIQFKVADGLAGPPRPILAPVLSLTGSNNLRRQHGLLVLARCSKRCRLTVTARLVALSAGSNATHETYRGIGAFVSLDRLLPANREQLLNLRATPKLVRAYCGARRHGEVDAEVHLAVHGQASDATQAITLSASPRGTACSR